MTTIRIDSTPHANIWPDKLENCTFYEAIHKTDTRKCIVVLVTHSETIMVFHDDGGQAIITMVFLQENYTFIREIKELRMVIEK